MSYQKYCDLIDEFYFQTEIDDVPNRYENTNFNLLEIPVTLAYGGEDTDNLLLFCEFGELPEEGQDKALRKILECNMELFAQNAGQFSINPETGQVLLMVRLPLDEIEKETFVGILMMYASMAKEWRQTYFLTERTDLEEILNTFLLPADSKSQLTYQQ